MTQEHYERLMALFDDLCDLDSAAQDQALSQLGEKDPELARELALLLQQDRKNDEATLAVQKTVAQTDEHTDRAGHAVAVLAHPAVAHDINVISLLAAGGMGRVMLARQKSLDRDVAVKTLQPEESSTEEVERLVCEARLLGSLEHPNIVPVHCLGIDRDGLPLLVMKRVEGVSWRELIDQSEHPAWSRVLSGTQDQLEAHLSILNSVCSALDFAHSRGVIHRDIKPDNVMVGAYGEVYLVDWGLAIRIRDTARAPQPSDSPAAAHQRGRHGILGTPGFMAPEMAMRAGPEHSERTDVYLVGASLHYVLTRQVRHPGCDLTEILERARRSEPFQYAPDVPSELAALCNWATQRDPAQRPATIQDIRTALLAYLRHRGSIELSSTALERLQLLQGLLSDQTLAAVHTAAPHEIRQRHELMTECLFGFRQSLLAWPENAQAKRGLRECQLAILRYELAQENLSRAQALLAEISDPPAALQAGVCALREALRTRNEREAQLRAIEQAMDVGIGARLRAVLIVFFFFVCLVLWRYVVRDQGRAPHVIPPQELALGMAAAVGTLALILGVFRRRLFTTEVNYRFMVGILCCLIWMVVNRALHMIPAPTTASIVSNDQLLAAAALSYGGLALSRWLWLINPIFLFGALISRLVPGLAGLSFGMSCFLFVALALLFFQRSVAPSHSSR